MHICLHNLKAPSSITVGAKEFEDPLDGRVESFLWRLMTRWTLAACRRSSDSILWVCKHVTMDRPCISLYSAPVVGPNHRVLPLYHKGLGVLTYGFSWDPQIRDHTTRRKNIEWKHVSIDQSLEFFGWGSKLLNDGQLTNHLPNFRLPWNARDVGLIVGPAKPLVPPLSEVSPRNQLLVPCTMQGCASA